MYRLYPRLPLPTAESMVSKFDTLDIDALRDKSSISHESMQFAPTGGNRIDDASRSELQKLVRNCASEHGYPYPVSNEASRQFDVTCGILLHQEMQLHPSEASHLEMWAFMGCILLPDVVRWRFSGEKTSKERFIGADRGLRRHTFGRLWWRSYLLSEPEWDDPYKLIRDLYEDDLVQITERSSIPANPILARAVAQSFLKTLEQYDSIARRDLIREASKRLFRLFSIISFDVLNNEQIRDEVDRIFAVTVKSLLHEKV